MPQMTPAGARVVDPILSTVAQGFKNAAMVGMSLFPYVPVGQRGGRILSFGREDFALYATGRAPGANTKRMQFGYAAGSYALEQHALEGVVPQELLQEAQAVPGIDLARGAVAKVQNIIALRLEKAQADLATNAALYGAGNKVTLAGASQWNDYTGTSNPAANIETAKEAVRAAIGKRPNTVVMGAAVFARLRQHPTILDRIKYTGRDSATPELLASLFGVQAVLIGDAIFDNNGAFADVWGKSVVVAHTEVSGIADMGQPTFGYTYRLGGYPLVETPYEDRNAKSWIYPVTDEVSPVIAGASAGYLISAAVA
ncbi:MAG: major capsid protein [Sulfuritalea sp.]|nr:major capsid protein [Sulfuritalea sp.]